MTLVLIDTSVAIGLRDLDPNVAGRAAKLPSTAYLSIISAVELEGGVVRSEVGRVQRRQALDELLGTLNVLDFGIPEAKAYGQIVAALGFSRRQVADRMIAAQALVAGATLVTLNPRDFSGIPGLAVEDWSA